MAEPCPIAPFTPSRIETPSLCERCLDDEMERLLQDFHCLEIDKVEVDRLMQEFEMVWTNVAAPQTPLPAELWHFIFLQLPVPTLLRMAQTCKFFCNIVKGERSLKIIICSYRVCMLQKKWEKIYENSTDDFLRVKQRSFLPLQRPLPAHRTDEEVEEHFKLLERSQKDMSREVRERRIFNWCIFPLCVIPTILTCGCGGLCCLGCAVISLKNKITRGTCTLEPDC